MNFISPKKHFVLTFQRRVNNLILYYILSKLKINYIVSAERNIAFKMSETIQMKIFSVLTRSKGSYNLIVSEFGTFRPKNPNK